jgi:hypothetical protein
LAVAALLSIVHRLEGIAQDANAHHLADSDEESNTGAPRRERGRVCARACT